MSAKDQPKSLVAKLAEACNAVGGVEKRGRNEHQKYSYVRAADITKAFRRELFQRGILLTKTELEITPRDFQTYSGASMREITLKVEYSLRDGETGEVLAFIAYGVAMDSGDKAIYKAKTGALKYFLRDLGLVPDEKDDPEFDESVDEETDSRVYQNGEGKDGKKDKKGKRKSAERVAEYQIRAFNSAHSKTGKTAQQVADYLRSHFNVLTVADLSRDDFQEAIKWALGTEALAKTLENSLASAPPKPPEAVKESYYESLEDYA